MTQIVTITPCDGTGTCGEGAIHAHGNYRRYSLVTVNGDGTWDIEVD